MMNAKMKVAVIGGGASGLAAAISAARAGGAVTLIEAQPRVGRKLLSTGNGRCNITNAHISPEHYRSGNRPAVERLLGAVPPEEVNAFLRSLGLELFEEREGRVYPRAEQASAVLDMLRAELHRLGVQEWCEQRITAIEQGASGVRVLSGGAAIDADRVIVACGSQASPQLGGCRDGVELLRSLGHTATALSPALAPVEVASPALRSLKGIRSRCRLTLTHRGKALHTEAGELQFNEDNLSGIVTMQMSSYIARAGAGCVLSADLMPDYGEQSLAALLTERRERLGGLTADVFMAGLMNKRLALAAMKQAGVSDTGRSAARLSDRELSRIAAVLKGWEFPVTGVAGWKQAQVMSGGVPLDELDDSLRSRRSPGVYICGELLDCDGDCGGYNLHWAWVTGIIAGCAAAGRASAEHFNSRGRANG